MTTLFPRMALSYCTADGAVQSVQVDPKDHPRQEVEALAGLRDNGRPS